MRICGKLIMLFLFLFALATTEGCSKKNPDPVIGSLSGKVKVKGEPLTGGQLIFKGKDGKGTANLTINSDGTYRGTLPLGEMLVAVDTESVKKTIENMQGKGGSALKFSPEDIAKFRDKKLTPEDLATAMDPSKGLRYVEIPEKYRSPDQSGFSVKIEPGSQQKDFDIP
jgi:hypothetical protein